MLTLDHRLRPHPDAVDTELETNELVLLHLQSKAYFSLNLTGMRIWQGLKEGLSLRDISHRLQQEFDVDSESAERSVLRLAEELFRERLVEPPE